MSAPDPIPWLLLMCKSQPIAMARVCYYHFDNFVIHDRGARNKVSRFAIWHIERSCPSAYCNTEEKLQNKIIELTSGGKNDT
jgi:hypothetical protein